MSIFVKDETNIRTTPLYIKNRDEIKNITIGGVPSYDTFSTNKMMVVKRNSEIWCFDQYQNRQPYFYYIYLPDTNEWRKYTIPYMIDGHDEFNLLNASIVELNGEIHVLGTAYIYQSTIETSFHFKYGRDSSPRSDIRWRWVGTLPYNFYNGSAVVLNGEIHILGGRDTYTKHYKYSNGSWVKVSTLPYSFYNGSAVVLNDEIHILGGTDNGTKHYKYSNDKWVSVSTLPYKFYNGSATVLNNDEIHILGGIDDEKKHYKYSNNKWVSVSILPYDGFYYNDAITVNDEIYIFGSSSKKYTGNFAKLSNNVWDICPGSLPRMDIRAGTYSYFVELGDEIYRFSTTNADSDVVVRTATGEWIKKENIDTIPYDIHVFRGAVVLNNEIHVFGSPGITNIDPTNHYKYSNGSWTSVSTLPYRFGGGSVVASNGEIHILGGGNSKTKHYKYSNGEWVEVSTLPYDFHNGSAVVIDDEIHIFGSYDDGSVVNARKHYKYSNGTWINVDTLPIDIEGDYKVVNIPDINEIHIFNYYGNHYYCKNGVWFAYDKLPKNCAYAIFSNLDSYIYVFGEETYYYGAYYIKAEQIIVDKLYDPSDISYSWIQEELLPMEVPDVYQKEVRSIVVSDNHMYLIGNDEYRKTKIYKYLNRSWFLIDTINHDFDHGGVVALNDGIHIFGEVDRDSEYIRHYIYSDGNVTEDTAIISSNTFNNNGLFIGLGDEIHAFNGFDHYKCSMAPNDYEYIWTFIESFRGFAIDKSSAAVVLNDEIHVLGGNPNPKLHYKYSNGSWVSVSTLPYNFAEGSATVLNNEIHILGGIHSLYKHYKYSNGEWVEVSTLPFQAWYSFSVTIGKTIHLLGGMAGGSYSHYKYDISNLFAHVFNKIKNIWVKTTSMDKSSIDNYQITEHVKKVKAIWVKDSDNKAKRVYY